MVWNTALLFFQLVLLAGYAGAHFVFTKVEASKQRKIYIGAVLLGLIALPIRVPGFMVSWYQGNLGTNPDGLGAHPALNTLLILAVTVGLPFLALSSGAPTLQRWFSQTSDTRASNPYFLYAASNIGSMIALLGYPAVLERYFPARELALVWTVGYILLIPILFLCARATRQEAVEDAEPIESEPVGKKRWLWILLGVGPSAALVGLTNFLTTNVAPMPLLWVLPLALYLLSFIIVFSNYWKIPSGWLRAVFPFAVFPSLYLIAMYINSPIERVIPTHLACFFVAAVCCHGAVSNLKPAPSQLTDFYLSLSIGGAIGGFLSSILAPILLPDLFEYQLALVLSAAGLFFASPTLFGRKVQPTSMGLSIVVAAAMTFLLVFVRTKYHGDSSIEKFYWLYVLGAAALITSFEPILLLATMIAFVSTMIYTKNQGLRAPLFLERNFFGVHLVRKLGMTNQHRMVNGNTIHGAQDLDKPKLPLTYYSHESGLGQVFGTLNFGDRLHRCALIGLGVGTTAAYGKKGQEFDFYELDPSIERMARNRKLFTYLTDCDAKTKVLIGDARLRIAEAQDSSYDLIAVDAFASDAVPVHLLTKEAAELYLRKLNEHGILAIHISNRYLRLHRVVSGFAKALDLKAWVVYAEKGNEHPLESTSSWILLTRKTEDIGSLAKANDFQVLKARPHLWTDDYSDVLSVVVWNQTDED